MKTSFIIIVIFVSTVSISLLNLTGFLTSNSSYGEISSLHKPSNHVTKTISNSTEITRTSSAVDKFGIKEIYLTKQGGREWYINMNNPKNDSLFSIQAGKDENIIKQADGSWHIKYAKVRMSVGTPPNVPMWKNVEITGYAKVDSVIPNNNKANYYTDLAWFARGGRHTQSSPCDGMALIGGIHDDGTVGWKKEIWFTRGYTNELAQAKVTNSIVGRWIGWKVVMYNINNNSAVKMESYLDDKNNNHWIKVTDIVDDGGWYANSPDSIFYSAGCGRAKDYIITNAGPDVAFRSDNLIWDFKNLSVREIKARTS
jgi:hypothetical protein